MPRATKEELEWAYALTREKFLVRVNKLSPIRAADWNRYLDVIFESINSSRQHAVEVVVDHGEGSFEALVSTDFHLFAGDAAQGGDGLGHGLAVDKQGVEFVEGFYFSCYGGIEDAFGESHELLVLGHEVGFALEGEDPLTVLRIPVTTPSTDGSRA